MKTVQVYRLWDDGTWDLSDVEVEDQPWTPEIVESRAVQTEWLRITKERVAARSSRKPLQIGLYMASMEGLVAK